MLDPIIAMFWPPSYGTAPALLSVVIVMATAFQRLFLQGTDSPEQQVVNEKKKRTALALMQIFINADERKEKQDEKKTQKEESVEDNADGKGQDQEEDKGEDDSDEQNELEASKIFDVLFDESEDKLISQLFIADTDERYIKVCALLKNTMEKELKEGTTKTKKARKIIPMEDDDDEKAMMDFEDGATLFDSVEFCRDKVMKRFGKDFIDKDCYQLAVVTVADVAKQQRKNLGSILKLAWSSVPMYVLGVCCTTLDIVCWPILEGMQADVGRLAEEKNEHGMDAASAMCMKIFVGLFMCQIFCLFGDSITAKITARFTVTLKCEVMRALVRQDIEYFDRRQAGALQERLNRDADQLAGNFFGLPGNFFRTCVSVLGQLAYLKTVAPDMLFVILLPLPVTILVQMKLFKIMDDLWRRMNALGEKAASSTMEIIAEIRTVREFTMENEEAEKYARNSVYMDGVSMWAEVLQQLAFSCFAILYTSVKVFTLYFGARRMHIGKMTQADLMITMSLAFGFGFQVQNLFETVPKFKKMLDPAGRICELLSNVPKVEPGLEQGASNKLCPERFAGDIEFVKVEFSYPTARTKTVLKNVSFQVHSGQKVALVGSAGCGKSSTINLVKRFYKPLSGTITIDGQPIENYDLHVLRRAMAVVAQETVLFNTTIRENICYGVMPEPSDDIIRDALEKASAWSFVSELSEGLDTLYGEKGIKLSGGQKQRITIARAIIRKPTILLLDEATSALDSVNEKIVQKALDKLMQVAGGSALVIAHRLTTIKNCDKIIVFDKGEVKEEGNFDELMTIPIEKDGDTVLKGWFHNLWDTQMGESDEKVTVSSLEKKIAALEEQIAGHRKQMKTIKENQSKFKAAGQLLMLHNRHRLQKTESGIEQSVPSSRSIVSSASLRAVGR